MYERPDLTNTTALVVVRLPELQKRASSIWRVRVTQTMLAETTSLSLKKIQHFRARPPKPGMRYQFATLGMLCWYFGCGPQDLLTYLPAGTPMSSLPQVHIGRPHLPLPQESPPLEQLVRARLPRALDGLPVKTIMQETALNRDTIAGIRDHKAQGITSSTLIAVCRAAQQRQPRQPISIGEILWYEL